MAFHDYQIPPPATWQKFEKLCHLLWMDILNDRNIQLHGRQGQSQAGVDVYGTDAKTKEFTCIQCKGKNQNYNQEELTESDLRKEVEKAKNFTPIPPQIFILATTAPNDQKIQKVAREITEEHKKVGLFKVFVMGWDDLCQRIAISERVINEFYPHLLPKNDEFLNFAKNISKSLSSISNAVGAEEALEPDIDDKNIKDTFAKSSLKLSSWPQTLKVTGKWIERAEEENLMLKLRTALYSTTIFLGEPGTGKSALLARITQNLLNDQKVVLGIKADHLNASIKDFESLSKALKLPASIEKCILQLSKADPVFLIIDQLDALSELIDVKTERLSVLLNLIKAFSENQNVHIIASSRPFEFEYDQRLASLDADQIFLPVLAWENVMKVFEEKDIHLKFTDEKFQKFLRRPSNLNFYLKYIEDHPQKSFQSHLELYEDIWQNSLGENEARARRVEFLIDAAAVMTNEAKQSLPTARYDAYKTEIGWLCQAGLLIKEKGGKSFSFAHQTLQAFAWTRSFIQDCHSLTDFVLKHQDNLNIRPKLSTALFYIREADIDEYKKQISSLLKDELSNLRRHILYLLIECIGAQNEPLDIEIYLFSKLLERDELVLKICKSILGKAEWFDAFKSTHLSSFMKGKGSQPFAAAIVISSVTSERKPEVFSLIKKYWKNENSLNHLHYVIRDLREWDDEAADLAYYILQQKDTNDFVANDIVSVASEANPDLAPNLAAKFFEAKLEQIEKHNQPTLPLLPENANATEKILWQAEHDPKKEYENLLNFDNSWHNLPVIAEAAPKSFIQAFWPFLERTTEIVKLTSENLNHSYTYCNGIWFKLSDDEDLGARYFSDALELAIQGFAKKHPEEFLAFINKAKKSELMPQHRLLAKGIAILSPENPDAVLSYLLEDGRRLMLGSFVNEHYKGTIELIVALTPHLSDNQIGELEKTILAFEAVKYSSEDSVKNRRLKQKANRLGQYLLLRAIPETKQTKETRVFLNQEERALEKTRLLCSVSRRSGFMAEKSPMSIDQMEKAREKDLLKCLTEFADGKERHLWNDDFEFVGSSTLARTFGEFTKANPEKALKIIKKLDINNTSAVICALGSLSETDIELNKLLDLIDQLCEKGFKSNEFYIKAARSIENKIEHPNGLNDDWCKKLESWMKIEQTENVDKNDDSLNMSSKKYDDEKPRSLLWDNYELRALPLGNFPVLCTLTHGLMLRNPPACPEWIRLMKSHVKKNDDIHIWLSFTAFKFRYFLPLCDSEDATDLLDSIIQQYPKVIQTIEFCYGLAWACKWANPEKYNVWMQKLYNSKTKISYQLFGELLGLRYAISGDNRWVHEECSKHIKSNNNTPILAGLTHALINLWDDPDCKARCTEKIIELINLKNKTLSYVVLGIFRKRDVLEVNDEMKQILDALIQNKTLEEAPERFQIVRSLSSITNYEPERVSKLTSQLINIGGKDLGNIQTAAAGAAPDLITIAITLHNMGPTFQTIGLEIFESLLELEAYKVIDVLKKIDSHPQIIIRKTRRKRK